MPYWMIFSLFMHEISLNWICLTGIKIFRIFCEHVFWKLRKFYFSLTTPNIERKAKNFPIWCKIRVFN